MAQEQPAEPPPGDPAPLGKPNPEHQEAEENANETALDAPSLPYRRSGRIRSSPRKNGADPRQEQDPVTMSPSPTPRRQNLKRKAAPEHFELPDELLEASLGPWKENELAEWSSWIEVESDPAFFTAILRRLGVKGALIEEVLSVDEGSLAALPNPVYGLVFLYEYFAEEMAETTEDDQDVWFANQTTQNACATIALLNIVMNAKGLRLGDRLRALKEASQNLPPPLRGNMINHSDWIRVAHNSFARRLDLLNAALALQNEAAEHKKRTRSVAGQRKKARRDASKEKASGGTAYHFIAFVPIGQRVWQLDGLAKAPVCIGKFDDGQDWTSVMSPILQERMMRYSTECLSFSLLALCGDPLAQVREQLAANIRRLRRLEARPGARADRPPSSLSGSAKASEGEGQGEDEEREDPIVSPTDPRIQTYQLEPADIADDGNVTDTTTTTTTTTTTSDDHPPDQAPQLWQELAAEQKRLRAEHERQAAEHEYGFGGAAGAAAVLGRAKDYTAAVHEWVKKLAGHEGALKRLWEEARLQQGL
ncbi:hypothetical protein VTJ83DRAFT_2954 [Remersonia thermophila]|uniref:ubiquitinyl hydrolase 1 n=1 Tax=Remersonia thermophila TaxID=72144 RepID=A0ABR4DCN5_9PEZI